MGTYAYIQSTTLRPEAIELLKQHFYPGCRIMIVKCPRDDFNGCTGVVVSFDGREIGVKLDNPPEKYKHLERFYFSYGVTIFRRID